MTSHPPHHWASRAFGVGAGYLLAGVGAALGLCSSSREDSVPLFAVIILTAIAMGLRNASVRRLAMADLTTTVLTSTISGLATDSSLAGGESQVALPARLHTLHVCGSCCGRLHAETLGRSAAAALIVGRRYTRWTEDRFKEGLS
jgi:uncharacterized membrane protein YoaK (UPF0700 family)